jgi:hypothetical protein
MNREVLLLGGGKIEESNIDVLVNIIKNGVVPALHHKSLTGILQVRLEPN